jgi:hypothetical protein
MYWNEPDKHIAMKVLEGNVAFAIAVVVAGVDDLISGGDPLPDNPLGYRRSAVHQHERHPDNVGREHWTRRSQLVHAGPWRFWSPSSSTTSTT